MGVQSSDRLDRRNTREWGSDFAKYKIQIPQKSLRPCPSYLGRNREASRKIGGILEAYKSSPRMELFGRNEANSYDHGNYTCGI
jgi:hypothetical protein